MSEFIKILLPTLLLFSIFFWRQVERAYVYSESFGDPSNYLTLNFERNTQKKDVKFTGKWTTGSGEVQVLGEKRLVNHRIQYVIELPEGRFVGNLGRSNKGCEPLLHYTVEKDGALIRHGKLRGAFCV